MHFNLLMAKSCTNSSSHQFFLCCHLNNSIPSFLNIHLVLLLIFINYSSALTKLITWQLCGGRGVHGCHHPVIFYIYNPWIYALESLRSFACQKLKGTAAWDFVPLFIKKNTTKSYLWSTAVTKIDLHSPRYKTFKALLRPRQLRGSIFCCKYQGFKYWVAYALVSTIYKHTL